MERIYLDTYGDGEYSYDCYVDWCNDNEIEPAEEGSHLHLDWVQQSIAVDVDNFFDDLKYASGENDRPCVVTGTLGLWDGKHTIVPREFEQLETAIDTCLVDCDYYRIALANGVVYIEATHHDGTNLFEIRPKEGTYGKYLF